MYFGGGVFLHIFLVKYIFIVKAVSCLLSRIHAAKMNTHKSYLTDYRAQPAVVMARG